MEIEILQKKLETAWPAETIKIAKELLAQKRTVCDEVAELQALWWHILNLCNWLSEERDKIDDILRRIS